MDFISNYPSKYTRDHPRFIVSNLKENFISTVMPAKNDTDVVFCLQTYQDLLSCQPRVTVTSCFVYKVFRDFYR